MKFARLLALALFGGALPAAAATYQVNGPPDMDSPEETGSVPETSSAAFLGLVGTTLLVRRWRF